MPRSLGSRESAIFGWSDLGRFLIAYGFVKALLNLIYFLALPVLTEIVMRQGSILSVLTLRGPIVDIIGITLALVWVLRAKGEAPVALGLRTTHPLWFLAALSVWAIFALLIIYGVPELQRGRFGFRIGMWLSAMLRQDGAIEPRLFNLSFTSLLTAGIHALDVALSAIATAGLVFAGLRTAWSLHWAAIVATFVSSFELVLFLSKDEGLLPALLVSIIGGLVNCYFYAASRSVLPGTVGAAMVTAFMVIYATAQ